MDILDNIIYASQNSSLTSGLLITSDYINTPVISSPSLPSGTGFTPVYNYSLAEKFGYCTFDDITVMERAITRHWYDIDAQGTYSNTGGNQLSSFFFSSNYHLLYAYLVENTRILQIFERVIERYVNDEDFGITNDLQVFNWIKNSERLFFNTDTPKITNLRSLIRENSDNSRRNAYYRMFGMDLAFGDSEDHGGGTATYIKAKAANQQFILLFERYLSEIWQGYVNRQNSSGANTADVNILAELAQQLEEMLIARRGRNSMLTNAHLNLSREEFSATLINTWFAFVVSYDSPIVNFLSCQSSTIGERLMKIGNKVGIPAHTKAQALFEMAAAAGNLLLTIETGGILTNSSWVQDMLSSLNPGVAASLKSDYMNTFLTVINNWEKATGHRIKNPEAKISGTLHVNQKTTRPGMQLN